MKLMYSIGLFWCWIVVVITIPFIAIGEAANWLAQKMMRVGDTCAAKGFVLLILLALLLSGCCKTTATVDTEKHLLIITRIRFLITEDIGSVSFDATDGSFTIDGYKSDMTRALELVKYFAALSKEEDKVRP